MQCAILIIALTLSSTVWVHEHSAHAFTCSRFRAETRFQPSQSHHKKQARVAFFAENRDGDEEAIILVNTTTQTRRKVSHLANDANLSSLTKNNPTWNQNVAALLEYKQINGTVNLPSHSKKYPNLGKWVHNLRQRKGRLTKDQIQQLDDIEFDWTDAKINKNDKKWMEMFMELQAYKEQNGDCLVSTLDVENKKLGFWVKTQRESYSNGNIKEHRKDMLNSIGFVWRVQRFFERYRPDQEELWEKRHQELVEFKEEHNHTNVPRDYPPNKELGIWVDIQRVRYKDGTLLHGRKPRLDKLGFTWEFEPIWDESWLQHYEELKTHNQELASYKEMMENSREKSKDATRPVLSKQVYTWASDQRRLHAKGGLDQQKKNMLDDIGFEWWEL